jgi:hypothetical protein
MGATNIIKELPRLTEADRRHIREVLLEIASDELDLVTVLLHAERSI